MLKYKLKKKILLFLFFSTYVSISTSKLFCTGLKISSLCYDDFLKENCETKSNFMALNFFFLVLENECAIFLMSEQLVTTFFIFSVSDS